MRDNSLDEFESLFEQASIPVLNIEDVALARITAVMTGGSLDKSISRIAQYLNVRFNSDVAVHRAVSVDADSAADVAKEHGFELQPDPFASTAELVGQIAIARSQLLLSPRPSGESAVAVDLDAVVQGTAPPVLVIQNPVEEPASIFRHVLHSVSGNFRQTQNFAYSFTLVEDQGRLLLLHVVEQSELDDVRDALRVSSQIDDSSRAALLENLRHHGERYLKAVVAASRTRPFSVTYRLAVGEVVDTVRRALAEETFDLLVVGSHIEGHSHVNADDYRLMHQVRDVPILAL